MNREENLDRQLKSPHGLSLDTVGNILVLDSGNKVVKIFSNRGQFLREIGGQGSCSFPFHCVQLATIL